MNKFRILITTLMVIILTSVCMTSWAQQWSASYSNSELDEILAPIALYPDPLIAQILPAATYPDQLLDADDFIGQGFDDRDIDQQDWDVSVKALAYYPSVLRMMVDKPDWTISVGQAYVDEPDQVMMSIQRLRNRARSYGYLSTNQYQRVYLDSSYIRIVPVQARYIYVPRYNPEVVYIQRRSSSSSNLISFGLGLLIGSWLNRDCDWGHHRVFYHGWNGGGWIGNSRSHVNITNNYYINNSYRDRPIDVDRRIRSRDIRDYRTNVRENVGTYRLPESRQPSHSTAIRNRDIQQGRPTIDRTAPRSSWSDSNSNARPSQGVNRRNQIDRNDVPAVKNTPRSSWSDTNSNARPSQGVNRRNQTDRNDVPSVKNAPRSSWSDSNSNARPSQGVNRRNQIDGNDIPAVKNKPRSSWSDSNSNARPSQDMNRRNQIDRSNAPSVTTEPRENRSDSNSNARSSQGVNRRNQTDKAVTSDSKLSRSDSKTKDKNKDRKNSWNDLNQD